MKTELFERSYNWHRTCQTTSLLRDSLSLSRSFFAVAATFKSIDYNVAMTFILNNNNNILHGGPQYKNHLFVCSHAQTIQVFIATDSNNNR